MISKKQNFQINIGIINDLRMGVEQLQHIPAEIYGKCSNNCCNNLRQNKGVDHGIAHTVIIFGAETLGGQNGQPGSETGGNGKGDRPDTARGTDGGNR